MNAIFSAITSAVIGLVAMVGGWFALPQQYNPPPLGLPITKGIESFSDTLSVPMTASSTSFTLVRGTNNLTGITLSGAYIFRIDNEFIEATCAGTACTISSRGLSDEDLESEVYTLKQPHARGATVKVTDAYIVRMSRILNGNETVPNILSYNSHPTLTANTNIVDKKYVDDSMLAGGAHATQSVEGITKLSLDPSVLTNPIAVGDNDPRVPTQNENDAMNGASASSGNRFITQSDTASTSAAYKVPSMSSGGMLDPNMIPSLVQYFGPGSEGNVIYSSATSLYRDMYYNNLTIESGVVLSASGYKIYVKGALTNAGTIRANGFNGGNAVVTGTEDTGGAGAPGGHWGTIAGGTMGSAGGTGANGESGSGGSGVTGNATTTLAGISGVIGAAGGNGTTGGGAGGPAGVATKENGNIYREVFVSTTTITGINQEISVTSDIWTFVGVTSKNLLSAAPSSGGGGGGGGTDGGLGYGGGGGGSGGTGGVIFISANSVSNTGAIEVKGGNGGNGTAGQYVGAGLGGGGGGGAGGTGGLVVLIYRQFSGNNPDTSGGNGGSHGLGVHGGSDGADGTAGNSGAYIKIKVY